MKSVPMFRHLVLSSLLAAPVLAQDGPPPGNPSRPPPPPEARRDSGDHDRGKGDRYSGGGGGGPGMPGFGRPPGGSRHDGFDKLPEDQKRRVREALDKVWSRPEVIQARDRAMKANEDFRDAIRIALQSIDPEAVKIMERVRPPDHFDPRKMPKLPPADSADFPRVALERMGLELVGFSRPDRRDEARRTHERVTALPRIQEAYTRLQNTTGEARVEAMKVLRDVYREEVGKEFQRARERRSQDDQSPRPPSPPSPPPGPSAQVE